MGFANQSPFAQGIADQRMMGLGSVSNKVDFFGRQLSQQCFNGNKFGFADEERASSNAVEVESCVDLRFPGIDQRADPASGILSVHSQGLKSGNSGDRPLKRQGQSLHCTQPDPYPGEGARSDRAGQQANGLPGPADGTEEILSRGQQDLCVVPSQVEIEFSDDPFVLQ